jgi:hypothetical protein
MRSPRRVSLTVARATSVPIARQSGGHHVIAKTDLRAGIVKARRPRARAGGAKRRALHDAEHRSSIGSVMVGASNEVQVAALIRAHKRATIVFAAYAGSVA